jgi:hypothetical protein
VAGSPSSAATAADLNKIDPRLMATTLSRSFVMRAEAAKEPVLIDDSDALFAKAAGALKPLKPQARIRRLDQCS